MVVAIIALLVAILLPSLFNVRAQAQRTACMTNLKQIGTASWTYATIHRDKLPDQDTLGRWSFRRAPGEVDPRDRGAHPEIYGLAAVLDRTKNLPARSDVWICPAQSAQMKGYKNTYAFSVAKELSTRTIYQMIRQYQTLWVWDNYNLKPGLTGFNGPFSGYTFSSDQMFYPHMTTGGSSFVTAKYKATCALYVDGHVQVRRLNP